MLIGRHYETGLWQEFFERKIALRTPRDYAPSDSTDNSPQLQTLFITHGVTDMSGPDSSIKHSCTLSVLHLFNTHRA